MNSTQAHVTVKEAAAYWRVSTRVVRHLIDKGALPAKKIGKEYRIHVAVIHSYGDAAYSSSDTAV